MFAGMFRASHRALREPSSQQIQQNMSKHDSSEKSPRRGKLHGLPCNCHCKTCGWPPCKQAFDCKGVKPAKLRRTLECPTEFKVQVKSAIATDHLSLLKFFKISTGAKGCINPESPLNDGHRGIQNQPADPKEWSACVCRSPVSRLRVLGSLQGLAQTIVTLADEDRNYLGRDLESRARSLSPNPGSLSNMASVQHAWRATV